MILFTYSYIKSYMFNLTDGEEYRSLTFRISQVSKLTMQSAATVALWNGSVGDIYGNKDQTSKHILCLA